MLKKIKNSIRNFLGINKCFSADNRLRELQNQLSEVENQRALDYLFFASELERIENEAMARAQEIDKRIDRVYQNRQTARPLKIEGE